MRPSVGKKGTDGKFVVSVTSGETRVMARRFKTLEEATDFFTRSVEVHKQKANRERVRYEVHLYETTSTRSSKVARKISDYLLEPH